MDRKLRGKPHKQDIRENMMSGIEQRLWENGYLNERNF